MTERLLYKPHRTIPGTVMVVPEGQNGAEIAARLGWPATQWAAFPESDFDPACYEYPQAFTLTAGKVGYDLSLAKQAAIVQTDRNADKAALENLSGVSVNLYMAQVALPADQRLAKYQAVIHANNAVAVEAAQREAAIAAAATVAELNQAMEPPLPQS